MERQAELVFVLLSDIPSNPRSPTCWRWGPLCVSQTFYIFLIKDDRIDIPVFFLLCRQGAGRCRRHFGAWEGKRLGAHEGRREGPDEAGRPDVPRCTGWGQSCGADSERVTEPAGIRRPPAR